MTIFRYTCPECKIVTRVEDNQAWKVCVCQAPPDIVNEDEDEEAEGNNGVP